MDSKTKTSILIVSAMILTIALGVIGIILVKNQSANQLAIQEAAEKSVTDMANALRKNTLEAEARAEERKKAEAKEKESSELGKRISNIIENATKK